MAGTLAPIVNSTSGTSSGLTCPFDRSRLEAVYSTDITIRVRCTYGLLADEESHEFSLPVAVVESYYRRRGFRL